MQRPSPSRASVAELSVSIEFPSARIANIILHSILPETRTESHFRSKTSAARHGNVLVIRIEASDLGALRAASNSFLKFISAAMRAIEAVSPFYSEG